MPDPPDEAVALTQWGSRDPATGGVFTYGSPPYALHEESARLAVRSRRARGGGDILLRRTISIGPWEEVPEGEGDG